MFGQYACICMKVQSDRIGDMTGLVIKHVKEIQGAEFVGLEGSWTWRPRERLAKGSSSHSGAHRT
jgi:hypothetical protein